MIAILALMAQVQIKQIDARSLRTFIQTSIEAVLWRGRWVSAALVIVGSALLLTHSRGGTMAALIGAAILIASAASAPSLRTPWRYSFVALGVLAAIAVFAVNGAGVLTRVVSTSNDLDLRFDIDSGTWRAIADNFLTGTGLGTFQFVYAPYQPPAVGLFVDLAHNDYLENILELGVPAAAVLYASLVILVWRCAQGVLRRRRDAIFACAALGASALVGSHAAVDFSMQMPAVAVTYAAMLGLGVAQSVGSTGRNGSSGLP
jgi:O-antigen ligase